MNARIFVLTLATLVPAAFAQTAPVDEPSRSSGVLAVGVGTAPYGTSVRLLAGSELRLSDHASIGFVSRVVGARDSYTQTENASEQDHVYYVEGGMSLRPVWRPTDRLQAAASLGIGVAALGTDAEDAFLPIADVGFTLPIEVDGSVRVWRGVGVTASASRSLALTSAVAETDVVAPPNGYALDHWTAALGIRVGAW